MADPKKQPIDLTRRTLVRIFSEGRFEEVVGFIGAGGKMYQVSIVNILLSMASGPMSMTTPS